MTFKEWVYTPAKWYQFWMPQSSFIGGVTMVVAVVTVTIIIILLF